MSWWLFRSLSFMTVPSPVGASTRWLLPPVGASTRWLLPGRSHGDRPRPRRRRYVGAILCTSLLGLVFSMTVTSNGLHIIADALAVVDGLLLVASIATRRHPTA